MSLATKYRPKNFSDVLGQDTTIEQLQHYISGGGNTPIIFSGVRGTGKTTLGRILGMELSSNPLFENSIDYVELDGASNNGVDNIRTIIELVHNPPISGTRIILIDEAHMLSKGASNALLKTLELPPKGNYFVLATTELNRIIPTIRSRCIEMTLSLISEEVVQERLKFIANAESIEINEECLKFLSHEAKGSMRDGITKLEKVSNLDNININSLKNALGYMEYADTFQIVKALVNNDIGYAITLLDTSFTEGAEPATVHQRIQDILTDMLFFTQKLPTRYLDDYSDAPLTLREISKFIGNFLESEGLVRGYISKNSIYYACTKSVSDPVEVTEKPNKTSTKSTDFQKRLAEIRNKHQEDEDDGGF